MNSLENPAESIAASDTSVGRPMLKYRLKVGSIDTVWSYASELNLKLELNNPGVAGTITDNRCARAA